MSSNKSTLDPTHRLSLRYSTATITQRIILRRIMTDPGLQSVPKAMPPRERKFSPLASLKGMEEAVPSARHLANSRLALDKQKSLPALPRNKAPQPASPARVLRSQRSQRLLRRSSSIYSRTPSQIDSESEKSHAIDAASSTRVPGVTNRRPKIRPHVPRIVIPPHQSSGIIVMSDDIEKCPSSADHDSRRTSPQGNSARSKRTVQQLMIVQAQEASKVVDRVPLLPEEFRAKAFGPSPASDRPYKIILEPESNRGVAFELSTPLKKARHRRDGSQSLRLPSKTRSERPPPRSFTFTAQSRLSSPKKPASPTSNATSADTPKTMASLVVKNRLESRTKASPPRLPRSNSEGDSLRGRPTDVCSPRGLEVLRAAWPYVPDLFHGVRDARKLAQEYMAMLGEDVAAITRSIKSAPNSPDPTGGMRSYGDDSQELTFCLDIFRSGKIMEKVVKDALVEEISPKKMIASASGASRRISADADAPSTPLTSVRVPLSSTQDAKEIPVPANELCTKAASLDDRQRALQMDRRTVSLNGVHEYLSATSPEPLIRRDRDQPRISLLATAAALKAMASCDEVNSIFSLYMDMTHAEELEQTDGPANPARFSWQATVENDESQIPAVPSEDAPQKALIEDVGTSKPPPIPEKSPLRKLKQHSKASKPSLLGSENEMAASELPLPIIILHPLATPTPSEKGVRDGVPSEIDDDNLSSTDEKPKVSLSTTRARMQADEFFDAQEENLESVKVAVSEVPVVEVDETEVQSFKSLEEVVQIHDENDNSFDGPLEAILRSQQSHIVEREAPVDKVALAASNAASLSSSSTSELSSGSTSPSSHSVSPSSAADISTGASTSEADSNVFPFSELLVQTVPGVRDGLGADMNSRLGGRAWEQAEMRIKSWQSADILPENLRRALLAAKGVDDADGSERDDAFNNDAPFHSQDMHSIGAITVMPVKAESIKSITIRPSKRSNHTKLDRLKRKSPLGSLVKGKKVDESRALVDDSMSVTAPALSTRESSPARRSESIASETAATRADDMIRTTTLTVGPQGISRTMMQIPLKLQAPPAAAKWRRSQLMSPPPPPAAAVPIRESELTVPKSEQPETIRKEKTTGLRRPTRTRPTRDIEEIERNIASSATSLSTSLNTTPTTTSPVSSFRHPMSTDQKTARPFTIRQYPISRFRDHQSSTTTQSTASPPSSRDATAATQSVTSPVRHRHAPLASHPPSATIAASAAAIAAVTATNSSKLSTLPGDQLRKTFRVTPRGNDPSDGRRRRQFYQMTLSTYALC